MDFRQLKTAVQRQFNEIKDLPLFRVDLDKEKLWTLYLASFPPGTNPMFRNRTEHDCSCCRSFVKAIGDMVAIRDGKLVSIWDCAAGEYQPVVDALSGYVKSCSVSDVFLHSEPKVGTDKTFEPGDDVRTWEHFHIQLPSNLVSRGLDVGEALSKTRADHDVLLRSLVEISSSAIAEVRDLISQNSLYRGSEKKALVNTFGEMKKEFSKLKTNAERDLYVWSHIRGPTAFVNRIRNDVIGTLLVDLSEGRDLEIAVKSFEDKVSGTNYKRPTSLITPRMRDAAKAKLAEMGLLPALERRFATLEDIKVTNVLFADRSAKNLMSGDVFDDLPVKGHAKSMDKVEEIGIGDFIERVLPRISSMSVLFENRHQGNLVSLTAPCDLTAKGLFKWSNPFAWSYNGDVADSIKERVKAAGGAIDGDVCCRLAWNNTDDLDFHMIEPGYEIFFRNRRQLSPSGGVLDVDANGIDGVRTDPCENIVYKDKRMMKRGVYHLVVYQYAQQQTNNVGFEVEIDVNGQVHHFSYPNMMRSGASIPIAELHVSANGIEVVPQLEASMTIKEVWGIKTQAFHRVQAMMLSPNFWNDQEVGNKHFLFMLEGCKNDGTARGFYNEFLHSALEPHRKAMEIVGSRMRTEQSENQLSGVGFSSTQHGSIVVKVEGAFTRTLKVNF